MVVLGGILLLEATKITLLRQLLAIVLKAAQCYNTIHYKTTVGWHIAKTTIRCCASIAYKIYITVEKSFGRQKEELLLLKSAQRTQKLLSSFTPHGAGREVAFKAVIL